MKNLYAFSSKEGKRYRGEDLQVDLVYLGSSLTDFHAVRQKAWKTSAVRESSACCAGSPVTAPATPGRVEAAHMAVCLTSFWSGRTAFI
jgi:hypothetical protein